jgi:hypothetical protein
MVKVPNDEENQYLFCKSLSHQINLYPLRIISAEMFLMTEITRGLYFSTKMTAVTVIYIYIYPVLTKCV